MSEEVSHKEILDRLVAVEGKVDQVHTETRTMVKAFEAMSGAFTVLDWIGKAAKPILWIGALVAAVGVMYSEIKAGK